MMKEKSTTKHKIKTIFAACIGNVVEWYDFSIYAYMAAIISVNFFETQEPITALLATFAAFAVGFIIRPLGGFVIGVYGDKVGRKSALSTAIILMALGTFMIGVLPTYETIGIFAPILLVIARLIQGFSAGGEWTGGATFIVEHAEESTKGFWGSFHMVSVNIGMLLGSVTGVLLTTFMSEEILYSWGWRIPFIIGGIIGLIGLYMRINMEETPEFKTVKEKRKVKEEKPKIIVTLIHTYKEVLVCIGITVFWTVAVYGLLTYMPVYLSDILGLSSQLSFLANTFSLILLIILTPIAGYLSDKFGRKQLLLTSTIGTLILIYPLFLMMASGSFPIIVTAVLILAALIATFNGPAVVTLVELFPANIRYSSFSVGYNIAIAAFGGTAPFISTYLIQVTGVTLAPLFYIVFAAIVTTTTLIVVNFSKFQARTSEMILKKS